jgi:hypothetical protein
MKRTSCLYVSAGFHDIKGVAICLRNANGQPVDLGTPLNRFFNHRMAFDPSRPPALSR